MNKNLFFKIFLAAFFFISVSAQGQNERIAYTVTDSVRNGARWNYLRSIDLRTGNYSNIILRLLNANDTPAHVNPGMINGVAAIAYDKKNKRLYYSPMLLDRLCYVDLRTMRTVIVKNNFTGLMPKATDQSNVITRMVIGEDDHGYALTNDGRHLVRFSTKNNPAVTDLGSLLDAPGNNEMSVHNACSSFGGDMIADDNGHLYLITSRNHVFKIKISNKVAKYKGTVSGLPQTFTTSGVAVDRSANRLVIVSSVDSSDVYTFNIRNLTARALDALHPWLGSDLANGNILSTGNDDDGDHENRMLPDMIVNYHSITNDSILLYPNPVTSNEFKIHFISAVAGNYSVDVMDAKGQKIMTKNVTTGGKNSTVSVSLPGLTSKGIFIVRITDDDNRIVFSEKIIVQ
jgi:Secretion system C-terminal sorting domain